MLRSVSSAKGGLRTALLTPSFVHVETGEESLIEVAPGLLGLADVEACAVFEQSESDLQSLLDEAVIGVGEFDETLGIALFDGEGLLSLLFARLTLRPDEDAGSCSPLEAAGSLITRR